VNKAWCMQLGDWDGTQASYEKLNNPESDTWPMHEKMMGTGPFTLNYWNHQSEIAFNRNDNYWRGKANFSSVVIKTVTEWTDRKLALEAGDADFVDVPVENYSEMDGVSGLTVYKDLPQVQVDALFFTYNISDQSTFLGSGKLDGQGIPTNFFTDINVRLAFEYSFDWDTYINQVLGGHGIQPDSPIVEGLSYYNANIPKYSLDTQKATDAFKAAWNGQLWQNGFTMTLAYNSGNTARKTACDILAANINALNPKFHLVSAAQQWSSYSTQWRAKLLPIFSVGWLPDYLDAGDFIVPFMSSTGDFSRFQGYGDAATDTLINQAAGSIDKNQRQSLYDQLSTKYYNDAASILLDQPSGNRYFKDWVKGYFFNPAETNDSGNPYYLSKG
jgi:peptide/nickel transport system substrate-binding protein